MEEAGTTSQINFENKASQSYAGNFLLVFSVVLLLVGATWLQNPGVFQTNFFSHNAPAVNSASIVAIPNSLVVSMANLNQNNPTDPAASQVSLLDRDFYQKLGQGLVAGVKSTIQILAANSTSSLSQAFPSSALALSNSQASAQPQVAGDFISSATFSLRGPTVINLRGPW